MQYPNQTIPPLSDKFQPVLCTTLCGSSNSAFLLLGNTHWEIRASSPPPISTPSTRYLSWRDYIIVLSRTSLSVHPVTVFDTTLLTIHSSACFGKLQLSSDAYTVCPLYGVPRKYFVICRRLDLGSFRIPRPSGERKPSVHPYSHNLGTSSLMRSLRHSCQPAHCRIACALGGSTVTTDFSPQDSAAARL